MTSVRIMGVALLFFQLAYTKDIRGRIILKGKSRIFWVMPLAFVKTLSTVCLYSLYFLKRFEYQVKVNILDSPEIILSYNM
jgi:hypothetical protein